MSSDRRDEVPEGSLTSNYDQPKDEQDVLEDPDQEEEDAADEAGEYDDDEEFISRTKIRSRASIEEAAGVLHDRLWHRRSQQELFAVMKGKKAPPPPEIWAKMKAEMARIEAQLGKDTLQDWDWEWEDAYLRGKLAALDWVLGEQWPEQQH